MTWKARQLIYLCQPGSSKFLLKSSLVFCLFLVKGNKMQYKNVNEVRNFGYTLGSFCFCGLFSFPINQYISINMILQIFYILVFVIIVVRIKISKDITLNYHRNTNQCNCTTIYSKKYCIIVHIWSALLKFRFVIWIKILNENVS